MTDTSVLKTFLESIFHIIRLERHYTHVNPSTANGHYRLKCQSNRIKYLERVRPGKRYNTHAPGSSGPNQFPLPIM